MTREEAITTLKKMHDTYDEIHESTNFEIGYEQMTALDMAIEALSADAVTIHEDGTLNVKVPNAQKVGRVLVMDTDSHIGGGLFYPDEAVPQSEQYKKGFEDAKRAFLVEYARERRNAQLEVMLNGTVLIPQHQWIEMERELAELKSKFESADAVQGEWIEYTDCEGKTRTITCSKCGWVEHSWVDLNYCPSCGSRMKGGDSE